MTVTHASPFVSQAAGRRWRRAAPTLIAAAFGLSYVVASPPSGDLAAHLFRAWLFSADPFGIWNNYWYAGHHTIAYSVLYPAASAALTPQIAAALASTGAAALFEVLTHRRFGDDAWLGAALFAAGMAADLFTGRLAFAFGTLPALASVVALDRERTSAAVALAVLSALSSPVAALFTAVVAAAYACGAYARTRRVPPAIPAAAVAVAALAPIGLIALAFPEGGSEPFAFSAYWPIPVLAAATLLTVPGDAIRLRAGVVVYALVTTASYLISTPLGSNAARLGSLLAAPLAALLLWPRRAGWLAIASAPLLYIGWQAPIRDLVTVSGDPSTSTAYYRPVLSFLEIQQGPPFRVEIPFTRAHWEAYAVATHVPIARGWERQLDIKYDAIFYSGRLTAATYAAWLHDSAVRFVALPDAPLDYSGLAEARLIDRGLSYLRLVARSEHWRIYAVRDPTPIAQGAARLTGIGPDWMTFYATAPGTTLVRVHFSPYWAFANGSGCVAPAGDSTRLTLRRAGAVRLVMSFAPDRVAARSPRCT
jgi:hypothetical protein